MIYLVEGGIALNVQFVAPVVPKTLVGMITKILEVSRTLHLRQGESGRSNTKIILKALKYSLSSFVIPVTSKYLIVQVLFQHNVLLSQ